NRRRVVYTSLTAGCTSHHPRQRRGSRGHWHPWTAGPDRLPGVSIPRPASDVPRRSEEHTSELQSRENLVCRLLLEKKKERVGSDCVVSPNLRLRVWMSSAPQAWLSSWAEDRDILDTWSVH